MQISLDELDDLLRPEQPASPGTRDDQRPVASRREVMVDAAVLAGAAVADHMGSGGGNESDETGSSTSAQFSVAGVSSQVAEVHGRYQAARYADVRQLIPSVAAMVDALAAEVPGTPSRAVFGVRCSLKIVEAKLATKAGNACRRSGRGGSAASARPRPAQPDLARCADVGRRDHRCSS
ncbi:hypothetical protein [Saccharopolyspora mangrovi]|uniref:Uncharacterized protein n=1 Tax=Saccharopolyspora mangrovi TaxID=3082379 RepID=A0ABU6ABF7_9PSEU|nr:hypothetical protein [Saccharopolyspora sp. S2-29]MEB3368903.1 hypothetical protein [Saccharopolyspora sp. S2-29]